MGQGTEKAKGMMGGVGSPVDRPEETKLVMPDHLSWQFSGVGTARLRASRAASGRIVNQVASRNLFSQEAIRTALENAQQAFLQRIENDPFGRLPEVSLVALEEDLEPDVDASEGTGGWTLVRNHRYGVPGKPD